MKMLHGGRPTKLWWSIKVVCSGKNSWIYSKNRPCFRKYKINYEDIVYFESNYYFRCPKCHCFTQISKGDIPQEARTRIYNVARKGNPDYEKLTLQEQKLSDEIFEQ